MNLRRSESVKSERSDTSQKRVSFHASAHANKRIPRRRAVIFHDLGGPERVSSNAVSERGISCAGAEQEQEQEQELELEHSWQYESATPSTGAAQDTEYNPVSPLRLQQQQQQQQQTSAHWSSAAAAGRQQPPRNSERRTPEAGLISRGTSRKSNENGMAQVIRPSDGYRRPAYSRSLAGLKPATTSLQQGFVSSSRLRSRSEDAPLVGPDPRQARFYQTQHRHAASE